MYTRIREQSDVAQKRGGKTGLKVFGAAGNDEFQFQCQTAYKT